MGGMRLLSAALAAAAMFGLDVPASAAPRPVATQSGRVQGVEGDGVTTWLGIPFAAPPVGDLRWRAPEPPVAWQGVRLADHFGAPCMQNGPPGAPGADLPRSEDCLYLNIWAAPRC